MKGPNWANKITQKLLSDRLTSTMEATEGFQDVLLSSDGQMDGVLLLGVTCGSRWSSGRLPTVHQIRCQKAEDAVHFELIP